MCGVIRVGWEAPSIARRVIIEKWVEYWTRSHRKNIDYIGVMLYCAYKGPLTSVGNVSAVEGIGANRTRIPGSHVSHRAPRLI